jgi:hypothetical protein
MTNNLIKKLPGGVGDNTPNDKIDPAQLSIGVQVEMEHTNDPEIAKEIAMDHLTEDPEYYTKLVNAGLAKEFQAGTGSGIGDPTTSLNDPARIGNGGLKKGNMHGSIGGTSDGQVDGRRSEPVLNKTIDIELEEQVFSSLEEALLDEKKRRKKGKGKKRPKPTNPALWARAKSAARAKFDVYPSAYANGWAAKWYKSKGGGWRMSEDVDESVVGQVFDGSSPTDASCDGVGTYGSGYDFVGYAESKKSMKKEQLRNIIKNLIKESIDEIEQEADITDMETEMPGDSTDGGETKTQDIKLTLDRETAQKLHDLLMAQLATSNDTEGGDSQPVAQDMDSDQLPTEDEVGQQDDIGEITFEQSREIEETKKKWIQNAIKPGKKGELHKQLGVPQDQKIPSAKLAAAAKKGGKVGQRARLAMTLSKLKKK